MTDQRALRIENQTVVAGGTREERMKEREKGWLRLEKMVKRVMGVRSLSNSSFRVN